MSCSIPGCTDGYVLAWWNQPLCMAHGEEANKALAVNNLEGAGWAERCDGVARWVAEQQKLHHEAAGGLPGRASGAP